MRSGSSDKQAETELASLYTEKSFKHFPILDHGELKISKLHAANDPYFSKIEQTPSNTNQSDDKNSAKLRHLFAFLRKLLKRFYCHSNTLKRLILLAFSVFSLSTQEGQYKHYPTLVRV